MVPAQYLGWGQDSGFCTYRTGPAGHTWSPPSSPGDVQENDALGLQLLNLGGQVSPVALEHQWSVVGGHREGSLGSLSPRPLLGPPPTHHHPDVLGQVLGAASEEVREGRLWGQRGLAAGDGSLPSEPSDGAPRSWGDRGLHDSPRRRTSCSGSGY